MKLYKQYLSVLKELKKGAKIKKAYFTSFNLSPEFFETYILPPLLEEEIPDNIFQYEALNTKLEENKIDIKVFYDANMLQFNEQKRTIIKFTPVLLTDENGKRKGLFHPKVIYLENDKGKGKLFVGSGNLTFEGWGRNTEAFIVVDVVRNSNLFNQIYNFFVDVEMIANTVNKKNKKPVIYDEKDNFVYSFENSENSFFLENMNIKHSLNLYVFSPYFSQDIDKIVDKYFKEIEQIYIIPDLVGNDKKIRLKSKPKLEKIKFFSLKNKDFSNMNHSKVWITDNKIGIGSYNFTREALFGVNFEAAFVRRIKGINLDLEEIDFNEMNDVEFDNEQLKLNTNFNVVFELIANWKDKNFEIKQIAGKKIDNFEIIMPLGIKILKKNLNNLLDIEKERIFRVLNKNKIFKIKYKNKVIYEGIITEISTKGFREPVKVETINDIFISFLDEKEPFSSRKLKNRDVNYDYSGEEIKNIQQDTSYLNYYNLFKGFENLKNKLYEIKKEEDLKKDCFAAGNSIISIKLVIEEYKENNKNLFTYLLIKEFNSLVNEINKIIKNKKYQIKKLEEIKNIKLNLSKKDKEFLKVFYG